MCPRTIDLKDYATKIILKNQLGTAQCATQTRALYSNITFIIAFSYSFRREKVILTFIKWLSTSSL